MLIAQDVRVDKEWFRVYIWTLSNVKIQNLQVKNATLSET